MKYFSVRDCKAGTFCPPFAAVNAGVAERMFNASVAEPGSMLNTNPEDFSLHFVGEFDQEKGVFSDIGLPEFICNAPLKNG